MTGNLSKSSLFNSNAFPFFDFDDNPLSQGFREIEMLMDDMRKSFFKDVPVSRIFFEPGRDYPKMNVYHDEKALYLEAAVPGFKQEDIEIKLEDNRLTINGKCSKKEEKNKRECCMKSIATRNFSRAVSLPKNINTETISARMEDGILSIALPYMREPEKPIKNIPISNSLPEPDVIEEPDTSGWGERDGPK